MSSIKNKIDALEESFSPQFDVTKDLADRLREARERSFREGNEERLRDLDEYRKNHPELPPKIDDLTIRGMIMRERLKESMGGL